MLIKFLFSLFKKKNNFVLNIPDELSSNNWDKTYKHLLEFNKTVITLSSSALILSFSATQLGTLSVNKCLLGISWMALAWVLISGICVYFFNYLYIVSDRIAEEISDQKKYKTTALFLKSEEALYYFATRKLVYFLSLSQLIAFMLGLIFLLVTAFIMI